MQQQINAPQPPYYYFNYGGSVFFQSTTAVCDIQHFPNFG